MFQDLEIPADAPTIRPVSAIDGSSHSADEDPEKQAPSFPSPSPARNSPILRRNVVTQTSSLPDEDVRPGAVMVNGPLPRVPRRDPAEFVDDAVSPSDSGAIQAELVDDVVPIEVTHVGGATRNERRRCKSWSMCTVASLVISLGVALVTFVLIFVVGIAGIGRNEPPQEPSEQVATQPTRSPSLNPSLGPASLPSSVGPTTNAPTPSSEETSLIKLIQSRSPPTTFEDGASPQRLALNWMLQDPFTQSLDDEDRLIQRFALAVIYFATGGPSSWNQGGGWIQSTNECTWRGSQVDVECSRNLVDGMQLKDDGLTGSIPVEIGLLTSLTHLDFFANEISGTIPSELGLLSLLVHVHLSSNNLEGIIPSELGLLTLLSFLTVASNKLDGTIPTELGLATSLTSLSADANNLQGTIPTEIGLLTSMIKLSLWANDFSGVIPSEVGLLTALTAVGFSGNNFHGTIPTEIGLATNLSFRLSFHTNPKLSGSVPSEFANLLNLRGLYLYDTKVSGSVPSNLCATLTQAQIDCGEIECNCCTSFQGSSC